jgi:hypothetical protein
MKVHCTTCTGWHEPNDTAKCATLKIRLRQSRRQDDNQCSCCRNKPIASQGLCEMCLRQDNRLRSDLPR